MKPVIITWGFDPYNGKLYLDCYLEVTNCDKDVTAVKMMNLRGRTQGTHLALLRIPKDQDREYIETYIKEGRFHDVVQLLNKAKVNISDITRKKMSDIQAIDFIMSK